MIDSNAKAICKCLGDLTREIYLLRQMLEKHFEETDIKDLKVEGKEIPPSYRVSSPALGYWRGVSFSNSKLKYGERVKNYDKNKIYFNDLHPDGGAEHL